MCGFYDDGAKIKKGDSATFKGKEILILDAKHVKTNKTMNIRYRVELTQEELLLNIPYKTTGYDIQLIQRMDKN